MYGKKERNTMEAVNSKEINIESIPDFMLNEERTYYSKKLQEAEKFDREHPKTFTSEEFHRIIKEKYGI